MKDEFQLPESDSKIEPVETETRLEDTMKRPSLRATSSEDFIIAFAPQEKHEIGDDKVRVFIEDHTRNWRREVRVAAQASVKELVPALITALGLPATNPAGRPVTYHLALSLHFAHLQMNRE